MKGQLHHTALNVTDYNWYVTFFTETFGMTVEKTRGEAPNRQLWFNEGVQINEKPEGADVCGNISDHIALCVDIDPVEAAGIACEKGCRAAEGRPAHWVALPNGALIELVNG